MPPNLDESFSEERNSGDENISLLLTPLSQIDGLLIEEQPSLSETYGHIGECEDFSDISTRELINNVFHEENLQELLVKVTDTENLSTITQLKLRVISRELTLQHLHTYTPALRELTLDGSVVASLRDIGSGLRNLKILRVNRCGLTCIDGVFGFENLQELYAADNAVTSLAQCPFISNLRVLDVRRNCLDESGCCYLSFCINLEDLYLEGNDSVGNYPELAGKLKICMPKLRKLDGFFIHTENINQDVRRAPALDTESDISTSSEIRASPVAGFSIHFPPRVCF